MPDEPDSRPDDGGIGDRPRRSIAERREFANVVVRWTAAANTMRAAVDAFDQSIESLRETGQSLDVISRNRKVSAILKTISSFAEAERRSIETRDYLQDLAEYLMALPREPPK